MKDYRLPLMVAMPAALALFGVFWFLRHRADSKQNKSKKSSKTELSEERNEKISEERTSRRVETEGITITQRKIPETVTRDRGSSDLDGMEAPDVTGGSEGLKGPQCPLKIPLGLTASQNKEIVKSVSDEALLEAKTESVATHVEPSSVLLKDDQGLSDPETSSDRHKQHSVGDLDQVVDLTSDALLDSIKVVEPKSLLKFPLDAAESSEAAFSLVPEAHANTLSSGSEHSSFRAEIPCENTLSDNDTVTSSIGLCVSAPVEQTVATKHHDTTISASDDIDPNLSNKETGMIGSESVQTVPQFFSSSASAPTFTTSPSGHEHGSEFLHRQCDTGLSPKDTDDEQIVCVNNNSCLSTIENNNHSLHSVAGVPVTGTSCRNDARNKTDSDLNAALGVKSDVSPISKTPDADIVISLPMADKNDSSSTHSLEPSQSVETSGVFLSSTDSSISSAASSGSSLAKAQSVIIESKPSIKGASKEESPSKSASPVCDSNSEGSNDSGRGCSDQEMACQASDSLVHVDFNIPSELCGRFIGKQGRNINFLKKKTGASVFLTNNPFTPEYQICQVVGSKSEVGDMMAMIRHRFPLSENPLMTMIPLNLTPTPAENPVVVPDVMQLSIPEGVSVDVYVSAIVDAGHVFIQQPTHRSFMSLEKLNYFLNTVYGQDTSIPMVPMPVECGVICVCEQEGVWYRAMIMSLEDAEGLCQIKYVDYGGYSQVPCTSLKQIRTDFMNLPFQAVECLMANITPMQTEQYFSEEATLALSQMTEFKLLQCQVVARTETGMPYIHLYQIDAESNNATMINRALVNNCLARWVEIL